MLPKVSSTIIAKWKPILQSVEFPEKYIDKVCGYCEWHAMKEIELAEYDMGGGKPLKTTLPLSISVLKQIKDLSKISFTPQPAFLEMVVEQSLEGLSAKNIPRLVKTFKVNIDWHDFYDLAIQIGEDNARDEFENKMVEVLAEELNTLIDKGHQLTIFQVVSQIAETRGVANFNSQLIAVSRFWYPGCEEKEENKVSMDDL